MRLFKISQEINNDYDTYSDAVVCAEDEGEAQKIHPCGYLDIEEGYFGYPAGKGGRTKFERISCSYDWVLNIKDVKVEYIGEADNKLKKGVVCASYHAG